MSAQTPVREERQTRMHSEIAGEPITAAPQGSPFERGRASGNRRPRPRLAVAVLAATTLMSLGALLGARFIGRRVIRRGATRVTGGSPTIVVMFPFTAINLYGRRMRRLPLPLALPRVQDLRRRVQRARAAQ